MLDRGLAVVGRYPRPRAVPSLDGVDILTPARLRFDPRPRSDARTLAHTIAFSGERLLLQGTLFCARQVCPAACACMHSGINLPRSLLGALPISPSPMARLTSVGHRPDMAAPSSRSAIAQRLAHSISPSVTLRLVRSVLVGLLGVTLQRSLAQPRWWTGAPIPRRTWATRWLQPLAPHAAAQLFLLALSRATVARTAAASRLRCAPRAR